MLSTRDLILCELLVMRCKNGDCDASGELISLFERPLLYYIRRVVGSEADAWDIYQETWLALFRSLARLSDGRAFPAYLYRVAHNHAMAHFRRRRVNEEALAAMEEQSVADDSGEIEFSKEDAAELHAALDKLNVAHRQVLALYFMQDLSMGEIAIVLDVPVGTVKSRLHHAKRALKGLLEKGKQHDAFRSRIP